MGKEQGLKYCVVGVPLACLPPFLPAFCSATGQKGPPEIPARKVGSTAGVTQGGKRESPPYGILTEVPTQLPSFPASFPWESWSSPLH